jgi:hypothetical protein
MSDNARIPPTTDPLDESGGRALVEAWRASGLSGAAFCRQHDLRVQRLHYWRERLGYPIKVVGGSPRTSVAAPPPSDGFVQLVVSTPQTSPNTHVDIVIIGVLRGYPSQPFPKLADHQIDRSHVTISGITG